MKKLFAFLLAFMLLPMIAVAEEAATDSCTPITLTIGKLVFPAVLNDTTAAQDLLFRLPYTVTVNRGCVDFCGDIGEPLQYPHHQIASFECLIAIQGDHHPIYFAIRVDHGIPFQKNFHPNGTIHPAQASNMCPTINPSPRNRRQP